MSGTVSEELYRIRIQGSPGFYTNARSALTANSTFAHLMHRLGHHDMRDKVKPAGDAFETIIAAYRNETSAEAFQQWFRDNFTQLIHVACAAYDSWMNLSMPRSKGSGGSVKQRRLLDKAKHRQKAEKHPIRKPQDRRHGRASVRPSALRRDSRACASQVTVIDLTIDSDWEDEDELLEVEAILSDSTAVNTALRVPRSPASSPKRALKSITRSSMAASCSRTRRRKSDFANPIPLCTLNPTISGQPLMLGSAKHPIVID